MGRQSCSWLLPDIKRPLNPGSSRNCQHAFRLFGLSFLKCQVSVAIQVIHAIYHMEKIMGCPLAQAPVRAS